MKEGEKVQERMLLACRREWCKSIGRKGKECRREDDGSVQVRTMQ
jgi:hypothetical protein